MGSINSGCYSRCVEACLLRLKRCRQPEWVPLQRLRPQSSIHHRSKNTVNEGSNAVRFHGVRDKLWLGPVMQSSGWRNGLIWIYYLEGTGMPNQPFKSQSHSSCSSAIPHSSNTISLRISPKYNSCCDPSNPNNSTPRVVNCSSESLVQQWILPAPPHPTASSVTGFALLLFPNDSDHWGDYREGSTSYSIQREIQKQRGQCRDQGDSPLLFWWKHAETDEGIANPSCWRIRVKWR